jgi:hypothetical protein
MIEGGYGAERFFGLDFRRYDVGVGVSRTLPGGAVGAGLQLRFQPGESDSGLHSYRTELAAGFFSPGFVRFEGGVHLVYTMILRESDPAPVLKAIFGNIAGVGVGAHVGLGLVLAPLKRLAIIPGARATAEVFNGGHSYGGSATLTTSFE